MEREERGVSVVLIPSPLQGHIGPILEVANILFCNGFSIIISHTQFNSPNPSSYPHFTFCPFSDELSEWEASTCDPLHLTHLINSRCSLPLTRSLSLLLDSAHPIACLISDAALHFTRSVSLSLRLPRLVLRTGGASSFLVFSLFPLLRRRGYLPIQEDRGEEAVVELPPLKVKDLPKMETKDPEAFYEFVCRMSEELKASSGVIWNTFEELESSALEKLRQELCIPIYPIGPFHKHSTTTSGSNSNTALMRADESCISWLDTREANSVLYVSFGSIASISERQLKEMALGLAHSGRPFLWVLRPGLVPSLNNPLPDGFVEGLGGRAHVVKWAPQVDVLRHPAVGAFWTHNGWNSTLESICEGVPMICTPCFADQKVNAKYVSDVWRVGLQLSNEFNREEVERVVQRIMVEDEGKALRERALELKEKANLCLNQQGSSRRSLDCLITHILSYNTHTHTPSEEPNNIMQMHTAACCPSQKSR